MSKITQLIPSYHIHNADLETKIIVETTDNNITNIEMLNNFNDKKWNVKIEKKANHIAIVMPKNMEPGNYLVYCRFANGTICNKSIYTCYPHLKNPIKDKISISGEKYTIEGSGFNQSTKMLVFYGNNENESKMQLVNENKIICFLDKCKTKDKRITIKCITNEVESIDTLYLHYDDPIITSISTQNIPCTMNNEFTIYGKNLGKNAEDIEIYIGDFKSTEKNILYCSESEIKCKIKYDFEIGFKKIYVKVCDIISNEMSISITPTLISLSENTILLENIGNNDIILKGIGFNNCSKVFFNNIYQPFCEIISENEIFINIESITNPQEINISVETNGFMSCQNLLLKILDHDIKYLSTSVGFINEPMNIIIFGFGFDKNIVVIEKDNQLIQKINTISENGERIEFTFPNNKLLGQFDIYVIKNNISSNKYKYLQLPKSAVCYPDTIPITINDPEYININLKIDGIIELNSVKLQLINDIDEYFMYPTLTKIEKENQSIFSFKIKESKYIGKLNTKLEILEKNIEINDISFVPKITNVKPSIINMDEYSTIQIEGYGFNELMEIFIHEKKIHFDINENCSVITIKQFKPNLSGIVPIKLIMPEMFEINEFIFVNPSVQNIDFPKEIKPYEKPYFFMNCKNISENIEIIVRINNIPCNCTVESNRIIVYTDKYEKTIVNAHITLGCIFNKKTNIFYTNNAFTYPQIIYTDENNGLCTKNNSVIIKGYGIDKNTKIKVNDSYMDAIYESDNYIITIPCTNISDKYEITTVSSENADSLNKLIYYTTPEITELSRKTGGIQGDYDISIHGIGFSKNISAIWFDEKRISENFVLVGNTITCKVPNCENIHFEKTYIKLEIYQNIFSNALEYQYVPQIDGQSIYSGYANGGYNVSLYGYGFQECNKIEFGNIVMDDFLQHTNEIISFVIPCISNEDIINIKIVYNDEIISNVVQFKYLLPNITSIQPDYGYIRGGEKITIFGEGISDNVVLYVDDTEIKYTITEQNTIQFMTPEVLCQKNAYFWVQFKNKKSRKLQFTYNPQKITSIYPTSGTMKGGYPLIIKGEGFLSENICVNIGNKIIKKSEFTKHTDEIIELLAPSSSVAGEINICVLVNNVKSENNVIFTYITKINSISATNTFVNTIIPITIEGEGFTGMSIVKMGEHIINNTSFDSKNGTITFSTPILNTMQILPISVITNNFITNEIIFTIKPIVKTINPNPWIAEDIGFLHVLGEGFSSDCIGCIMGVDKTEPKMIEPIKISNNTLVFAMPYVKNSGEITLSIGTLKSNNDTWISKKIMIHPKITKLSEHHGSILGGNNIEIIGKGFNKYSLILINDECIDDDKIKFINENTIILNMPYSNELKDIKIAVKCNGILSNYVSYTYSPLIKDIKPNFATLHGGSTTLIYGEGFNEKSIVIFNNKAISKENMIYDEKNKNIEFKAPEHYEVESVFIKVITNGIESCNSVKFFYTPYIDNISLSNTSVNKQDIITITGDGFCTNSFIKVGDKFIEQDNILKITNDNIQFKLPIIDQQSIKEVRVFTNSIPTAITKTITFSAEFTNIVPNTGKVSGGTTVNIYGNGFNEDISIFFNDAKIEYNVISTKQIAMITPKDAGKIGKNKIIIQSTKFLTNYVADFICYPVLSYMTQNYNAEKKKMCITMFGHGFTKDATVEIGNLKNIKPIYSNNSLKIEIDEKYQTQTVKPIPVNIIVDGLKTHDEIYYSNVPYINSWNKNAGYVSGGDSIALYGAGFEKDNTTVMIEEFDIQIKPFYITSSVIKFKTPKSNSCGKIHFIVISNNFKSTPFEFTYCPAIQSASETICNVGEEMKFKIYGEGFENSNMDIYVKNHGKCKLIRYINNKILEVKLPNITKCGIAEIGISVQGIHSFDVLKINIRPIILYMEQEYAIVKGGFIEINGIGLNNANIVMFICKEKKYEFTKINVIENGKKYERIKIFYDELEEWKKWMEMENIEFMEFEIIVKGNNVESLPSKFFLKNTEYKINPENEVVKAVNIFNNYLYKNYVFFTYNLIETYSEELIFFITQTISKICDFPEKYANPEVEKMWMQGFMKLCKNIDINKTITEYEIMKMVKTVMHILCYGIIHESITTSIHYPFTISIDTVSQNYNMNNEMDYDYLFLDCIEYTNEKIFRVLNSSELSKAISYRNLYDDNIEFHFNDKILNNVCNDFATSIMQKKFILCNNSGKFKGTEEYCNEGTIPELFIYKMNSAISGNVSQNSTLFDMNGMKQTIINSSHNREENSLGNQLKNILTKNETIKKIYEQLIKNNPNRFQKKSDEFIQIPFQSGDKIRIQLFISSKIRFKNAETKANIKMNESVFKACDPDIYDKSNPIDYLLDHDATQIRATRDCYEITLG
jgi:hypothetical protein